MSRKNVNRDRSGVCDLPHSRKSMNLKRPYLGGIVIARKWSGEVGLIHLKVKRVHMSSQILSASNANLYLSLSAGEVKSGLGVALTTLGYCIT